MRRSSGKEMVTGSAGDGGQLSGRISSAGVRGAQPVGWRLVRGEGLCVSGERWAGARGALSRPGAVGMTGHVLRR